MMHNVLEVQACSAPVPVHRSAAELVRLRLVPWWQPSYCAPAAWLAPVVTQPVRAGLIEPGAD